MRTLFKDVGIATAVMLLSSLAVAARAQWSNSLAPRGAPAGELVLVRDGRVECQIELRERPAITEQMAAKQLQHWIAEITGEQVEIVSGPSTPATASAVLRIQCDRELPEEGYRIALDGNVLTLAGGPGRGVVNAVYALLEEDLGCRFYTSESIKIPNGDALAVRPVARSYTPRLRLRDPFYAPAFDADWSLRNRTNAPRAVVPEEYGGHIDYGDMFVHTSFQMVPPDKYFGLHPEYFMLDGAGQRVAAQLCTTDPEVLTICKAYVLDVLRKNPHTELVSISKNDSGGDQLCLCERCKKLRADEGGEMACQLALVNGVAEAVEKEYPLVVIDTLAYLDTLGVPKTVRPRQNVAIRLCNNRPGAFTPASQCEVASLAKAWGEVCERIYIWDYNANFHHYLSPVPNLDVMAGDVRFWVENKVEGVMLQGGYQGPSDRDELKSWVSSKLLWDPSRDVDALVQDFLEGHYRQAAPALVEYEALLATMRREHAAWMAAPEGGVNFPMTAPFLSKHFLDAAAEIFEKAQRLAAGDAQVQRRIERARLPILYVQCARGPEFVGPDYAQVVNEFERIARQENVAYLTEGPPNLDVRLAEWRAQISPPASPPATK